MMWLVVALQASCVHWSAEARYRPYGYDHVVHLYNDCPRPAECTIATNVHPQLIYAEAAPGAETEVVTWVGSPAREFEASVSCALRYSRASSPQ